MSLPFLQSYSQKNILRYLVLASTVILFSFSIFSIHTNKAEAGLAECLTGGGAALAASGATTVGSIATGFPVNSVAGNVLDTVNNASQASSLAKECLLDPIAITLREVLIRKITSSIVTWINSGFEGSPAFVTNIDDFLLDTADEAFGTFIFNDTNFANLCSPFQFDIRFALALSYSSNPGRPVCKLSDIVDNVETAIDDLSVEWDWDVYETITTDPGGNIFSSYIQSQENLSNFIAGETNKVKVDIELGGGFLSQKNCKKDTDGNSYGSSTEQELEERSQKGECYVETPGSIINSALANSLNTDVNRIGLADEFDEIIGALMGQLAQQAFGPGGVSGLSKRTGSSRSLIEEYNNESREIANEGSDSFSEVIGNANNQNTAASGQQGAALQALLQTKIEVSEVVGCYESKFTTFVDVDGEVISPEEANDIPDEFKERASFKTNKEDSEILTPQDSLLKINQYLALQNKISQDLLAVESTISQNSQTSLLATQYQQRIKNATDPAEVQRLFSEYSQAVTNSQVNFGSQNISSGEILRYTNEIREGTDTKISASAELARCQTFNFVVKSDS